MYLRPPLALGILISLIVGCGDSAQKPVSAKPLVPAGPGVVTGTVRYHGPAVDPKIIGGQCCPGSGPVPDESVVVGRDGTLANVVVWIDDGPNVAPIEGTDAVLTQQDCRYKPHVMAVRAGRRIDVTSHDPTMHNVHIEASANPPDNFGQSSGSSRPVKFDAPDLVIFKCDVHPWMKAFVRVFDHPCYAVTGPDGTFRIDRLPPGTYKLVAWHERFGQLTATVIVKDGMPVSVPDFVYQP